MPKAKKNTEKGLDKSGAHKRGQEEEVRNPTTAGVEHGSSYENPLNPPEMSKFEEQRGSEVEEKKQKNAVRTGEVCCGILIAIVLIMMGFTFWVSMPCTFICRADLQPICIHLLQALPPPAGLAR